MLEPEHIKHDKLLKQFNVLKTRTRSTRVRYLPLFLVDYRRGVGSKRVQSQGNGLAIYGLYYLLIIYTVVSSLLVEIYSLQIM